MPAVLLGTKYEYILTGFVYRNESLYDYVALKFLHLLSAKDVRVMSVSIE